MKCDKGSIGVARSVFRELVDCFGKPMAIRILEGTTEPEMKEPASSAPTLAKHTYRSSSKGCGQTMIINARIDKSWHVSHHVPTWAIYADHARASS